MTTTPRYQLPDGREVTGSADDVIRQMADSKFILPRSLRSYRRATARRVRALYGAPVDATSNASLLRDLLEIGLIKRVG